MSIHHFFSIFKSHGLIDIYTMYNLNINVDAWT